MQEAAAETKPKGNIDPECLSISEKQFMRDHTIYSAASSWLFAIAGATNIGLLSVLASKILSAVEQGKPIFRSNDPKVPAALGNKVYNRVALGMIAFGGACMTLSNWLESKKVVTEWQLGAGKLQRKANVAEERIQNVAEPQPAEATTPCTRATAGAAPLSYKPGEWATLVRQKPAEPAESSLGRVGHG